MDTDVLEELGLTRTQVKAYLALLEAGESTVGPILKATGLQNSVTHLALGKLVEKGFASYVLKGKRRHYHPTDPKTILKFVEERKKRFEDVLPELLARQKAIEKQEAEVYEGFEGFKAMSYKFIEGAKKGDEYLYFSFYTDNADDYDNVYNFYKDFEKERKKMGIILKGVALSKIKRKYEGRDLTNVKFVDFPVPTNLAIFKDRVILTPWGDRQVSFLIHSKQLAETFKKYFYSVYDN